LALLLTVLLTALGAAWLAGLAGLAAPLGAFMAGVLVGESEIRQHAEGKIRPFRDVLMGLFFVTVGVTFDLDAAAAQPLAMVAWLAVFLFAKPAVVLLVGRVRRWPGEVAQRGSSAAGSWCSPSTLSVTLSGSCIGLRTGRRRRNGWSAPRTRPRRPS
jgi:CPA2 family monovalent cation:H+ antiporter-2